MKLSAKALIIAAIALIALPVVAWTGTFFYRHVRIKGALRDLEIKPVPPGFDEANLPSFATLH